MHMPLSQSSIIKYWPKRRWCSEVGNVTAALAAGNTMSEI